MTGPQQGPVWPGPGPQPPSWPAPPPSPKPERGPRPSDLTLSVQLWIFVLVMSAISWVAQAVSARGAQPLRDQYEQQRSAPGDSGKIMRQWFPTFEDFDRSMFLTSLFLGVVGVAVAGTLVFLMWRGQSWARVALQFVAAFVVVLAVQMFFSHKPAIAVPAILAGIAVIGSLITANSRESLEYLKPGSTTRWPS